tara:strand:+ start:168 stop:341 length:174 start_codon:yes stop_codon:yes gene_type:complete
VKASVVIPLIKELDQEQLLILQNMICDMIGNTKVIDTDALTEQQAIENLFNRGHLKR